MPKIEVHSTETLMGPLECSLAFGLLAAETRGSTQPRGIGVNDTVEEQRLEADHAARLQESANFQLSAGSRRRESERSGTH